MRLGHGLKHKVRKKKVVLEEDFEIQKDSTTNISTPNIPPIISSPMQTKTEQESKSQGRPKRFYIMLAYLKDYEVMKDFEIIDQGLVNFCLCANCDSISYEEVMIRAQSMSQLIRVQLVSLIAGVINKIYNLLHHELG